MNKGCPRPGEVCYEYHCGGNDEAVCNSKMRMMITEHDAELRAKVIDEFRAAIEEKCYLPKYDQMRVDALAEQMKGEQNG